MNPRICLLWLFAAAGMASVSGVQAAVPTVFGPGVISGPANDAAPTFTPDGRTVYFFRSNHQDYDILVSHRAGDRWSTPEIAPFSGRWRDLEPAISPDGSYLIFASSWPLDGGNRQLDGAWNGQTHAGKGGNLWRVNREGHRWSQPVRLPEAVNRVTSTFGPSIARDGSLYFMAATGEGGRFQLWCSRFQDGHYQPGRPLPFSTGQWSDFDAAVASDQSFIVFASSRPPTPAHTAWVFITYRESGRWSKPVLLGPEINRLGPIDELRLAPDGHTLYFGSGYVMPPVYPKTGKSAERDSRRMVEWNNGNENIWKADLSPWLHSVARGWPASRA